MCSRVYVGYIGHTAGLVNPRIGFPLYWSATHNGLQHCAVQCSAVQCSAVPCCSFAPGSRHNPSVQICQLTQCTVTLLQFYELGKRVKITYQDWSCFFFVFLSFTSFWTYLPANRYTSLENLAWSHTVFLRLSFWGKKWRFTRPLLLPAGGRDARQKL